MTTVIFPVSSLHIQLDTNTGKNGESSVQLFKRSMIKMPKIDIPPVLRSEYPFFTKNVRYPSSIENADWKTKYEFFFNRDSFITRLNTEIANNSNIYRERLTSRDPIRAKNLYEWSIETEKRNIMITLRALFPIPEVFGNALKNSYDHVLTNSGNSRITWDVNVKSALNIFGFMYKFGIASKEKDEYFINIGGKRYEVNDVVWENDLVNHRVYGDLIKSQREVYEEIRNLVFDVDEKYYDFLKKFELSLKKQRDTHSIQKWFYKIVLDCSGGIVANCGNELHFLNKMQALQILSKKDIGDTYFYITPGNITTQIKFLIHKNEFTEIINNTSGYNAVQQRLFLDFSTNYHIIERLGIDDFVDFANPGNIPTIDNSWRIEFDSIYQLRNGKDRSKFLKDITDEMILKLKTCTVYTLKSHIEGKLTNITRGVSGLSGDRAATAKSIQNRIDRLVNETGIDAAETIISIKEEVDNHQRIHNSDNIRVFMDDAYERAFNELLKGAIELKAASIVQRFVKNNTPMNLSDKNPDGSDVAKVTAAINKYISTYFTNETAVNNKLSNNVKSVYEPVRKTSNAELYKVFKLFKLGDALMKREYGLTDTELNEYRGVLNNVYEKYVLNHNIRVSGLDKYLYTGVELVGSSDDKNSTDSNKPVYEIYAMMNLVDADKFEKDSKASCKLLDKGLEQEFMYLADPLNKNNTSLSRFRNLDFGSVIPNPVTKEIEKNAPAEIKPPSIGGKWTRSIRTINRNKTSRHTK